MSTFSSKAIRRLKWVLIHFQRQFAVVAFLPAVVAEVFQQTLARFHFDAMVFARSMTVVALCFTWMMLPPCTASPTPTAFQQIEPIDGSPEVLRELRHSKSLEELEVSCLTDDGVEDLIAIFRLKRLHLRVSSLSDEVLIKLCRLDRLTELSFEATHGTITNDGIARLRSLLPDCRFTGDVQERTKEQDGDPVELNLRIIGGEKNVALAGIDITLARGYGSHQKKFGPFRSDESGTAHVNVPPGFSYLHLSSEKEWPFLPCEKYSGESSQGHPRSMQLWVTDLAAEKWPGGQKRDAGVEQPAAPDQLPRITYTLIPACEIVLRAVDADTGKGLKGASFCVEVAAAEDWAHPIDGDNVGAESYFNSGNTHSSTEYQTEEDGCFRRYLSEFGEGVMYGVDISPPGYELLEPRNEVNIETSFGKARAEHVFKFRRIK